MHGLFAADLVAYFLLLPVANYIFIKHRWTGFLPWYFMILFCVARIAGGGLGVHDDTKMAPNIIQSVGITPLILAVDGLTHEARRYRFPSDKTRLNWTVVVGTSMTMGIAVALSVVGAIKIYQDKGTSTDVALWKAGSAVTVIVWAFQVFWAMYSILPREGTTSGPAYQGSTALLQGGLIALVFIGIRVIYSLVAVATERRDLSPVYGKTVIRVVLMFIPELLATMTMMTVGIKTRHLRTLKEQAKPPHTNEMAAY